MTKKKQKAYPVLTRKFQVWDEITVFEADSEQDAIEQSRIERDEFHYAVMVNERIKYSRIAREDELDDYILQRILGDV